MRIARELHDIVAHTVAVIGIQARVATDTLADDPEQARTALHPQGRRDKGAATERRSARYSTPCGRRGRTPRDAGARARTRLPELVKSRRRSARPEE